MEKWKRSARLVDITRHLLTQPYRLIPLTTFAEQYQAAKSSISEDLDIIHEVLEAEGNGKLETVAGAAGGVRYIPSISNDNALQVIGRLCEKLSNPERILPGGFLYMSDLLGDPTLLDDIGRIFAKVFAEKPVDVVMTVETKGIPIAYATASYLRAPVVIARYDYRVTEGSVVTVNTVSGSSRRMQQLSLSKRSLPEGSRVLIIDDFMKAGGTVRGMMDLLTEFKAEVVGVGVMLEAPAEERLVEEYVSLAQVAAIDVKEKMVRVETGNAFH
ncbi:pur operon repressor [Laceyella sacchari]|uniref:Purine operon repressor, PurR n=1 Tax=Laceyella tengchongensis TaxID=574699 RepID=A0AA45WRM2_9BACL|nr:pur operon repressor [Laceyella tengchongensis]AUS07531.1 pur operon repressor [Laceyella sacchari]SMP30962.1 purine operon repressor, PurR [Laceyella tengchongensis]